MHLTNESLKRGHLIAPFMEYSAKEAVVVTTASLDSGITSNDNGDPVSPR